MVDLLGRSAPRLDRHDLFREAQTASTGALRARHTRHLPRRRGLLVDAGIDRPTPRVAGDRLRRVAGRHDRAPTHPRTAVQGTHQGHVRHLSFAGPRQPHDRIRRKPAARRTRGDDHRVFLRHRIVLHVLRATPARPPRRVDERIPHGLHRHHARGGRLARQIHRRRDRHDVRRADAAPRPRPTRLHREPTRPTQDRRAS